MLNFFYKRTDNAPLIIFRILLGLLMAWHCISHIFDKTVYRLYVRPKVTFTFIGMEWLQPLPGNGMYIYHWVMGALAICVIFGLWYRYTMGIFTVMWAGLYFMQKTVYNNHHYLLLLLFIIMLLLPANAYASVDSRINPKISQRTMPVWFIWIFVLQITIVYFFASVAKFYPDWMNGRFPGLILTRFRNTPISGLTNDPGFHVFIAWGGILFDMFIVPLLLYKRTRNIGALLSVGFHFFNWVMLTIGIFPFLSLSYLVFFYPPDKIRALFLRKKLPLTEDELNVRDERSKSLLYYFFIPYFIIQLVLPVRHYFIKGDVLWTEEGHFLSWRMMLKNKKGTAIFVVKDRKTGESSLYDLSKLLTKLQIRSMATKPSMIWQTAQFIKKEYAAKGHDVEIYVTAKSSVNKRPYRLLIDPETDLAHTPWNHFEHNEWITLSDK